MPADRPPIFDDGGGLPDVERRVGRRRPSIDRPQAIDPTGFDDHRGPNYLVRRALAVGAVVAVAAGAAIGIGTLLDESSDDSGSSSTAAAWNTIVTVDDGFGTVVVSNADGEETDRFRLTVEPLIDSHLADATLVAATASQLAIVQLDDTTAITMIDLGADEANPGEADTLVVPAGSDHTIIGRDVASQRAVFVHAPTGELIDTGAIEAVAGARYELELAQSDPTGRQVLVTDSGNFQSVLFSFDRAEPSYFPGRALAVSGALVVTAQNVGNDATVAVFDHAGEPGVSARTASIRAGMIVDGGVILVTVDGEITTLSLGSGETSALGNLAIGTIQSGHVTTGGDRLIVIGDLGTAVVDSSGTALVELLGAVPTTNGNDEFAPHGSECLVAYRSAVSEVVVIDLDDGAILAEALAGEDVVAGVNGCEPIVATPTGYVVITRSGVLTATLDGNVIGVSPDGHTVLLDNSNRLQIVPRIDSDNQTSEAAIDVGRSGRTLFFAET